MIHLAACAPARPLAIQRPSPPPNPPPEITKIPARPATPTTTPTAAPRCIIREISGITFEGVSFDTRSAGMEVADQAGGPGSQFPDAQSAGKTRGGIAAVNASFFTPEGSPLGLVVADGSVRGSWNNSSSLGSGIWYRAASGSTAIVRREKIGRTACIHMRQLIQAGPLLVEDGRTIAGLDATKTSARIAILWDGSTRWWLGRASPCTLATFATALASGNPAGWPTLLALNLDGGSSADLWISAEVPGGPITRRAFWNRSVRNFLVVKMGG